MASKSVEKLAESCGVQVFYDVGGDDSSYSDPINKEVHMNPVDYGDSQNLEDLVILHEIGHTQTRFPMESKIDGEFDANLWAIQHMPMPFNHEIKAEMAAELAGYIETDGIATNPKFKEIFEKIGRNINLEKSHTFLNGNGGSAETWKEAYDEFVDGKWDWDKIKAQNDDSQAIYDQMQKLIDEMDTHDFSSDYGEDDYS